MIGMTTATLTLNGINELVCITDMKLTYFKAQTDWQMSSRRSSVTVQASQTALRYNVGRFHPFIGHEGPWGEERYSSTLFLTSAIEGGEG
jgi:hypothetical protein